MRILLVDDAVLLRTLFTRIAAALGHHVVGEAEAPAKAIELARVLAPDAIVLDGRLRGAELGRLIEEFRNAAAGCFIFVVAGLDEPLVGRLARESGAAGLFRRPYSRAQIHAVLSAHESRPGRPQA